MDKTNKIIEAIQLALASIGGCIGYYLGEIDVFIYLSIAFVIADYLTGVLGARVERKLSSFIGFKRKLSSSIGFKGIAKKIMIFVIVGIGNLCDVNLIKGDGTRVKTYP